MAAVILNFGIIILLIGFLVVFAKSNMLLAKQVRRAEEDLDSRLGTYKDHRKPNILTTTHTRKVVKDSKDWTGRT